MKEIIIALSIINVVLLILVVFLLIKYKNKFNNSNDSENQIDELSEHVNIKKKTFNSETIDNNLVEFIEEPIELSTFVANINKLINKSEYKSITSIKIVNWLVSKGFINEEKVQILKEVTRYSVTMDGENIGIVSSEIIDKKTGEIFPSYLLSGKAQKYILEELVNIYNPNSNKIKNDSNSSIVNAGARWSNEEDEQLLDEYLNKKMKISEIAKIHGRKVGGIKSRLRKKHGIDI